MVRKNSPMSMALPVSTQPSILELLMLIEFTGKRNMRDSGGSIVAHGLRRAR
ncbi:MAG: hypothetical protein AAB473_02695 [Patescibacteria group bacterium]